jgi:uroporphyrin-III C-methyltransferase
VSLTTAMTQLGTLQAKRSADTEVFYMAGQQLPALAAKLMEAGWPADTLVSVVSRAGWPDVRATTHQVGTLAEAARPHAGRPAVVTVGAGARPTAAVIEIKEAGPPVPDASSQKSPAP